MTFRQAALGSLGFLSTLLLTSRQALAQECLALTPTINSGAVEVGVGHQSGGHRVGFQANANVAGKFGFAAGVGVGTLDSFAESGYEARGLLAIPLSQNSPNICVYGEYEQAQESFRSAMGMTHGNLTDYWFHLGYAVSENIGRQAGMVFSLHLAPELILRRTHIRGRSTHIEPEVHVLEHLRVWGDWYFGGRAMVSVRHSRFHLTGGVQNRPRKWADLHIFLRLGFPLGPWDL